ncbi:putative copper resistance protein D [Brevibacterium jeotgali]|uniref:Putative copper resistance protein D n=1 Tax=Brevibacterium jeotgali TaxID=1262550 RepID=A0A2H1L5T7_9MICO|nr:putative copper resistance protein D [Brevibacterium jeotgali]
MTESVRNAVRTASPASRGDAITGIEPQIRVAALPLFVLIGALAGSIGLIATGAAAPTVLADSGPLGRWGLPTAEFVFNAAMALTIGSLLLAVVVFPRTTGRRSSLIDPEWNRLLGVAQVASAVWTVSSVAVLVLTYVDTAGAQAFQGEFSAQLWSFITTIDLGRVWLSIVALIAVGSMLVFGLRSFAGVAAALVVSALPILLLSILGHSADADGHIEAVGSLSIHLVGVVIWLGGLLSLAVIAPGLTRRADLGAIVARYSTIALIAYALVMYSGLTNALLRVGGIDDWLTPYGLVLITKLALTILLGVAGWAHRRAVIGRLPGAVRAPAAPRAGTDAHAGKGEGAASGAAASGAARASLLFWRLVLGEIVLFGAATALGVVLSRTAPPVPDEAPEQPSAFQLLSGEALPPEPTAARYFTEWLFDPIWVVITVGAAVLYLLAVKRLRDRGDSWPIHRTICWLVGLAILFYVTCGGVSVYGRVLFSAHMLQHMALVMIAPIPLVLGAPVTLLMRGLAPRRDGSRGVREWVLAIVHSRYARFFSHPIVAAINFAGSLIVFYYSGIMWYALDTHIGHELMILHFLAAGYFFAQSIIGIDPGVNRYPYPVRLLILLVTMAFHAFFGISIMSSTALIAGDWYGNVGHGWVSAIEDQAQGGEIAWGIGEFPTLGLAIIMAVEWFKSSTREAKRSDRAEDRSGDAELEAYNAMLAGLAAANEGPPKGSGGRATDRSRSPQTGSTSAED